METDGRWQNETPYKEQLELLWHRFEGSLVRHAYNAESQAIGEMCWNVLEKWQRQRMDKREAEDFAEEHGRLEVDHRASRRTGSGHLVVCMPSLPQIPA